MIKLHTIDECERIIDEKISNSEVLYYTVGDYERIIDEKLSNGELLLEITE